MTDFASRLRVVREGANLNQTEFGRRLGVSQGHISGAESGQKTLSAETVLRLAEEFDVSMDWLYFGSPRNFRDSQGRTYTPLNPDNTLMLPVVPQRVSAGGGQILQDALPPEAHLPVLRELVAGHPREKLRVVEVRGDSMTGVHLFDGDLVIFVQGLVRQDGIYVIALDGDLLVKRLEWDAVNRRITIHSENARYSEPKHVPMDGDTLRIEGKVIGWYHRHPY